MQSPEDLVERARAARPDEGRERPKGERPHASTRPERPTKSHEIIHDGIPLSLVIQQRAQGDANKGKDDHPDDRGNKEATSYKRIPAMYVVENTEREVYVRPVRLNHGCLP